MPAINRSQLLRELLPGLNGLFGMEYKRYPEEWRDLYEQDTSERSFEEELKVTGFAAAPNKTEGGSVFFDVAQESYVARWVHETVAMGFIITEEAVEDNLYDSLSRRYTKSMARSMSHTKNVKGAAIINAGFSAVGPDGVALFATNHPTVGGFINPNRPATGADLNETSLEAAVITIGKWVDDRGLLIAAKPVKLLIPQDLQFVAKRIMGNPNRPATSDRDINALYSTNAIPQGFAVNHFFTDTNGWFLKTDVPNGLKMFQRVGLKSSSEEGFDQGIMKYKVRERYSFGYADPLSMYGSPGS
jgi:hypothetical protein